MFLASSHLEDEGNAGPWEPKVDWVCASNNIADPLELLKQLNNLLRFFLCRNVSRPDFESPLLAAAECFLVLGGLKCDIQNRADVAGALCIAQAKSTSLILRKTL
jgi:hypothetical protein